VGARALDVKSARSAGGGCISALDAFASTALRRPVEQPHHQFIVVEIDANGLIREVNLISRDEVQSQAVSQLLHWQPSGSGQQYQAGMDRRSALVPRKELLPVIGHQCPILLKDLGHDDRVTFRPQPQIIDMGCLETKSVGDLRKLNR
jgi:hypothetical protein